MRRLDAWVGRPACLALSALLRVFGRCLQRRPRTGARRILFIELSEMGSTVLAAPAFQQTMARHPGCTPCAVIFRRNADSLRLIGLFDEQNICTIRDESLGALLVDVVRFIGFCRAQRIDTAVDLELFARISSCLSMLSLASTRVGFDPFRAEGLYRGGHLTHRVQYNPYYHMSQNFLSLVEALEATGDEAPLVKRIVACPALSCRVGVRRAEYDYVRAELSARVDLSVPRRIVLMNHDAGALLPIRTWPARRFADVARALLAWDPRLAVVLVGTSDAADSAAVILREVADPRCVSLVGRTRTVLDLVQLFHQSDLLITNDSGSAHFASLTEIASITLFGPETARLYGPIGTHAESIDKGLACSPCLTAFNHRDSPCADNRCLQDISAAEVFERAQRLLGARDSVTAARAVE